MQPNGLRRRRFLQAGGAALAMAAAGCTSDIPVIGDDDGDGSAPAYADWVTTVEAENGGEEASVGYVDLAAFYELDDGEGEEGEEEGGFDDIDDPMLGMPLVGMLIVLSAGWQLGEAGLDDLLGEDADESYESSIDELILANGAIALSGSVDTEEIDAALTAEPDGIYGTQFERTDEVAGYAVYEPVENDDGYSFSGGSETTFAVGDGAIVVADEREGAVRAVQTDAGDEPRAVDEFDEFRRLLAAAGHGDMVWGGYSPDGVEEDEEPDESDEPEDPEAEESDDWFENVDAPNGVVASFSFGEDDVTAEMAIAFDDLDDDARAELESNLGSEADDVSVDISGGFVTATATYAEEDVEDAEENAEEA